MNPTEIKIPDVAEGRDDNEPKDEAQVAINSFSRKRTDHEFEDFDSKKIKMEPDRYETDLTYEIRTVSKIEYMSDDSGAANMSDVSEVPRFPGMITVFEMLTSIICHLLASIGNLAANICTDSLKYIHKKTKTFIA